MSALIRRLARSVALVGVVPAVVLAVAVGPAAPASSAIVLPGTIDQFTADCLGAVPAALSLPPYAAATPITLRVLVLADGSAAQSRAAQVFADAQASYAPLGVTLAPTIQSVSFTSTDLPGLITEAKAAVGGTRPPGSDVVFVLSSKTPSDTGVGEADCIGGVRFNDHAFAASYLLDDTQFTLHHGTAKVVAHEMGHLLGAQHHYANCAEGIPSLPDPSPCTLMFNDIDFAAQNFSTLSGAVVRGYAEQFLPARP
ncbi:MAG: zinc-dependent metalloprotease family protein [Acidimicrobiales bacterium]